MIKTYYNPTEQHVLFYNYGPETQTGDYVFFDLDTNLGTHRGWISIPTCGHVIIPLKLADNATLDKILEKGFEVKLWSEETGELLHWNQFETDNKPHPQNYFYNYHKGLTYGSWYSLIYGDEYDNDFVINEDDVVYDLGANVGVFTRWITKQFTYDTIYCFEPTPELIKGLEQTFQNDRVEVFDKAISDTTKTDYFYTFKDAVSNTMVDYPNKNENFVDKIEISCVNLEEFVENNLIKRPTFIKMDIEGEEYKVVKSWSKQFYESIRCIILEFHRNMDGEVFEIIKHMMNQGFRFKLKKGDSLDEHMGTIIFYKK